MSTVFRVSGTALDVNACVGGGALSPSKRWMRGEPTGRPGGVRHRSSGLVIGVSDADMATLSQQVADAIVFLRNHSEELARLIACPGVEDVRLDFAVAWREDVVTQTDTLPVELVKLAGMLGVGIDISHYPVSDAD